MAWYTFHPPARRGGRRTPRRSHFGCEEWRNYTVFLRGGREWKRLNEQGGEPGLPRDFLSRSCFSRCSPLSRRAAATTRLRRPRPRSPHPPSRRRQSPHPLSRLQLSPHRRSRHRRHGCRNAGTRHRLRRVHRRHRRAGRHEPRARSRSAGSTPRVARSPRSATARRRPPSARVQYINDHLGGIDGHPLELVECFVKNAEEEGLACGQQFLNDDKINGRRVRRTSRSVRTRSTRRSTGRSRSSWPSR